MNEDLYINIYELLHSKFRSEPDVVNEALQRVMQRVRVGPRIRGDVKAFAVGVALNVRREFARKQRQLTRIVQSPATEADSTFGIPAELLKEFMRKVLSKTERDIFVAYYLKNPQNPASGRLRLAQRLKIDMQTLYKRASRYRIRIERAYRNEVLDGAK